MKKGKIHIGTSGWHYKHWKGTFYPAGIADKDQFAFYSGIFSTVEINNSFYRLPEAETFKEWKKSSPENFLFAVKGSRFITHMKKLNVDKETVRNFFARAGKLGKKLGPVLFQLPPRWNLNAERLESFLRLLPVKHRYTFEFRNQSWYQEEVYQILEKYNVAFCIYELERHQSPLKKTADFVYIRLHGPGAKYQGSYTKKNLQKWAGRIKEWSSKGTDVYVYFDNDQEGYAAFNAQTLLNL
jgi:uncharacterized protein YecE (DUF72 family)